MSRNTPTVLIVSMVALLFVAPAATASPFPSHQPVATYADMATENTETTVDHATAITRATWTFASTAANQAQHGEVAAGAAIHYFGEELGPHGAAIVMTGGSTAVETLRALTGSAELTIAYGDYLSALAAERLRLSQSPPVVENGAPECAGGTIEELNDVLEGVPAGAEVAVCPGTYEGDLHVTTEFVTLRSVQGPWATTIRGDLVVEATGVMVSGFTVTGGGIQVGGDGDGYLGEIWGTILHQNVVQGNMVGIQVGKAVGTLLVGNTIRANGAGVQTTGSDSETEIPLGVVMVGNNLERNAFATQTTAPAPLVSIGDHFGAATPIVEAADGTCIGADGPVPCRNAAGQGTVLVAPSPVRHAAT